MKRGLLVGVLLCIALVLSAADKAVITVLDFRIDGVSEKEMRSLVSLLSSALFQTGKYKVIDIIQRDALLKEVAFSAADCADETCQLEIGKMLSAEAIVVGTVGKLGSRYMLSAKMLQTETAETLSVADGVYVSLDAMVDGLSAIAARLAGPVAPPTAARGSRSKSPLQTVAVLSCLTLGLGGGGVGGYLLWDGAVNGLAAIQTARSDYETAGAADAAAAWEALLGATTAAKRTLYWGGGSAAGGALLLSTALLLAVLPGRTAATGPGVSVLLSPSPQSLGMTLAVRY